MLQNRQQLTQPSFNTILFALNSDSRCYTHAAVYAAPTHSELTVKPVMPVSIPSTMLWGKIGKSPLTAAFRSQVPVHYREKGRSPTV